MYICINANGKTVVGSLKRKKQDKLNEIFFKKTRRVCLLNNLTFRIFRNILAFFPYNSFPNLLQFFNYKPKYFISALNLFSRNFFLSFFSFYVFLGISVRFEFFKSFSVFFIFFKSLKKLKKKIKRNPKCQHSKKQQSNKGRKIKIGQKNPKKKCKKNKFRKIQKMVKIKNTINCEKFVKSKKRIKFFIKIDKN